VRWQERTVPIHTLAGALGKGAGPILDGPTPAVIAGVGEHRTALLIDRLIDEVEVVVRPLGDILGVSPYFSAATIVGTDQVIPILDLTSLLQVHATTARSGEPEAVPRPLPRGRPHILLVEDAITTRELERSILEAAGYRVDTAMDGLDALQKLEHGSYQMIITDIEMPRMDGFELTARVRQEPRWAALPVIIISARVDEESRRRGLQAGAQGYIVKSRFDQGNLLGTISQLLD
jgi:two-component system chemotaxis sensor kinase CheA